MFLEITKMSLQFPFHPTTEKYTVCSPHKHIAAIHSSPVTTHISHHTCLVTKVTGITIIQAIAKSKV